ncbi:hypothetical protein NQ317_002859 [Molorchus minor]|uniref:Mab-21-like HhH/H2TH-like domain-containing protein n=1 Tax=Molorchus minor TaxID=1323400 RepID=A0ABQ9JXR7_9CUCU|nr:hypothetical protein NQ317_002859 [Molorchus minor]
MDSVNRLDEQCINTIKRDLSESPELFVLNNILMSIMFFANYQKEIQEASASRYNKNEDYIKPDILLEIVNKNVLYRPLHGPMKYFSEPVVAKRLYLVDKSINVVNYLDSNSSPCDAEKSSVQIEESPRKGFVKLRESEFYVNPTEEDIPFTKRELTPSTSRSSTDSDTTYDYTTLSDIKTPKPIEIVKQLERQDKVPNRLPNLPGSCLAYRKVKRLFCNLDLDEHLEDITEDDLYDIVSYVSSKGFMKYFQNSVFPNSLGLSLGFDPTELGYAKSIPGKIFCNRTEEGHTIPCEVVPALPIQWPHKQTLDFLMKGQKPPEVRKRYIFPTQRMINEIKALNCVLVPKGYVKKKGLYIDGDIEWEIQFPQAERYLETFISHAQAKCFIFLISLHKTYIEPKTFQLGLLTEHIRHFLLWECESNYSDWPEHRLGTKLIQIIKRFNSLIAKRRLPDYFVADKNHFENIPKKYLTHAQKIFHDVLESPVMSFIKSLRNLRYTEGKYFFPPLDFDRLYDILVKTGIESTNPQLVSELSIPPNYRKKRFDDSDVQLRHIMEVKRREKEIKKRQDKTTEKEKENLRTVEERRESADSIDLEWQCDKEFDIYKKRSLLRFFIDNFIDIAKKCYQISSRKQTLLYLKQAKYLTRILGEECPALTEEVEEYMRTIKSYEDKYNKRAVIDGGESPPATQEEVVVVQDNLKVLNSLSDSSNNEGVLKMNGFRPPRKSVAFAEIH